MELPPPREALVVLNLIPGLGSIRIQALLDYFGSAELVLAAPSNMLAQVPGIGNKLAHTIADWSQLTNYQLEMDYAEQFGVRVVTLMDDDYPKALRSMNDPPIVLYVRGEWRQDDAQRGVSIVGSRLATPYGMTTSRRMARDLADAGCTIFSGLAKGIDTAAHWGALDAGGRTIAVLGFGMAHLYPQENAELADCICNGHGAIVSEFPMHMRPSRTTFPQRNRVVAAWSQATIVTEAPTRSGSLHTAGLAASQYGKTVFAVPGNADRPSSAGCHALIRDGAILCTCAHDVLSDMNWLERMHQMDLFAPATAQSPEQPRLAPELAAIIAAIRDGHNTLDALCYALGMGACELTPLLMRLQVQQHIVPLPGGQFGLR